MAAHIRRESVSVLGGGSEYIHHINFKISTSDNKQRRNYLNYQNQNKQPFEIKMVSFAEKIAFLWELGPMRQSNQNPMKMIENV